MLQHNRRTEHRRLEQFVVTVVVFLDGILEELGACIVFVCRVLPLGGEGPVMHDDGGAKRAAEQYPRWGTAVGPRSIADPRVGRGRSPPSRGRRPPLTSERDVLSA